MKNRTRSPQEGDKNAIQRSQQKIVSKGHKKGEKVAYKKQGAKNQQNRRLEKVRKNDKK